LSGSDLGLNQGIDFVTEIIVVVRVTSRRYLNGSIESIRRAFAVSVSPLGINLIDFFLRSGVDNRLLYVSQIPRHDYVIELLPLRAERLAYKVVIGKQ
jgi:hypothetical protein